MPDEWKKIIPERILRRDFTDLPKVGDRCLFERVDGFRFFGLMENVSTVRMLLSGFSVSILKIRAWKLAYERPLHRNRR